MAFPSSSSSSSMASESNNASLVNPVGALQERFQSRGTMPEYTFKETDNGMFCVEVSVVGHSAVGTGATKKAAKAHAAMNVIAKLEANKNYQDSNNNNYYNSNNVNMDSPLGSAIDSRNHDHDLVVTAGSEAVMSMSSSTSSPLQSPISSKSIISELYELCIARGLPSPLFDVVGEEGEPHKRRFRVRTTVGEWSLEAEGLSKKEAKRLAFTGMLELVKSKGNCNRSNKQTNSGSANGNSGSANGNSGSVNSKGNVNCSTSSSSLRPTIMGIERSLCEQLRLSTPDVIDRLQQLSITDKLNRKDGSLCSTLESLVDALNLPLAYKQAVDKRDKGELWYIISIEIQGSPTYVYLGKSKDELTAREEAAANALFHFKIIIQLKEDNDNYR